jgi:hypothetical protein
MKHQLPMNKAHIEWSLKLFNTLKDGGAWGIPKCGLFFQRRGNTMVLTGQMPHDPAMPVSAEQLLYEQEVMYEDCKRHFEAAGIPVVFEVTLKRPSDDNG